MKKSISVFLISIIVLGQSGCATIVSGKSQDVSVRSNPLGANVAVDDSALGTTPMILKLKRKSRHTIKVTKEGYGEETRGTRRGFNWWFIGNLLFGGIIGIIVDFATGAVYTVQPEEVHVDLVKT